MDYPFLKIKIVSNKPPKMNFVPLTVNVLNIMTPRQFTPKENHLFKKEVNFPVAMLFRLSKRKRYKIRVVFIF